MKEGKRGKRKDEKEWAELERRGRRRVVIPSGLADGVADDGVESDVGVERLLTALEDETVAALQRQRRQLRQSIGARLFQEGSLKRRNDHKKNRGKKK